MFFHRFCADMAEKRKKTVVTMDEKFRALKRLDAGETAKKIAVEMGVGTSTISDWKKHRNEIEKWCSTQASTIGMKKLKMMKKAPNDQINECLYLWFTQRREQGLPMSGPLLKEKALHFNKELGNDDDFKASEGWLESWKNRYGVRKLQISGEKLSAQPYDVEVFKQTLHSLLEEEGYTGDQLYNCDETGLNYKMLPTYTLASQQENSAPGYKKKKERVTILACSNATGSHKLPLGFIGKSKKPRAFKNFRDLSSLPVWYRHQKSAWMNCLIFKEWFHNQFVPQVEKYLANNNLPRKAVLLLDNAPSHPDEKELKDGEIECIFLPPNVTSLCQPMDQGVLETMKRFYRRKLLTVLIAGMDEGEIITETLKKVDMLDVVMWVSQAWDDIKQITLVRSWRKLLDHKASDEWTGEKPEEFTNEDEDIGELVKILPGCEEIKEDEVNKWLNSDEVYEVTDGDILDMVCKSDDKNSENEEDENNDNKPIVMSHSEAFKSFEALLCYVQSQEDTSASDVMLLKRLRDMASKKRVQCGKQQKITNFFKN